VRFSPRLKRVTDVVANLCGFVFAAFFTYQSFASTLEMYRFNQGAEMINLPYWPFALFMGLCGLILTVRFLLEIFGRVPDTPAVAAPIEEAI
jgi:TRAP-type C4-dicarboxylate transport system permease small subunit